MRHPQTGRLAREPAMQNVPLRSAEIDGLRVTVLARINARRRPPDYTIVELRVLSNLAQTKETEA